MWLLLAITAGAVDCVPGGEDRLSVVGSLPVEVGDTVRVRAKGDVKETTTIVGHLRGPDPRTDQVELQPERRWRQRIGCDPVPGDPNSCRDPFIVVREGGRGAVLQLGPIQRPGTYELLACGIDQPAGEVRHTFKVGLGGFEDFPKLKGHPVREREVFRRLGARYRTRYGKNDNTIEVIWAPHEDDRAAAKALAAIDMPGQPVPGIPEARVRAEGTTLQTGWLTDGGFAYVQTRGLPEAEVRQLIQRLMRTWPAR